MKKDRHIRLRAKASLFVLLLALLALSGCSGIAGAGTGDFELPDVRTVSFDQDAAQSGRDCFIDASHTSEGYVMVSATSSSRLKFQMVCGDMSYNFDLPNDGTPTAYPMNMGDGHYLFRVMQNTEASNYIQLFAAEGDVSLDSEFEPFLTPSAYCDFTPDSEVSTYARQLASSTNTQVEAVDAIYSWVTSTIRYDKDKAASITSVTGYLPSPSETFRTHKGICFDYASLTAAMLRSIGVPCKIVTGTVSPDNIYHAWNMVYLDGQWKTLLFCIEPNEWGQVDTTFAASGATQYIGNGEAYEAMFTY